MDFLLCRECIYGFGCYLLGAKRYLTPLWVRVFLKINFADIIHGWDLNTARDFSIILERGMGRKKLPLLLNSCTHVMNFMLRNSTVQDSG